MEQKYEQTFVLIKPDALERFLVHKILEKIENMQLEIVATKSWYDTPRDLIELLYRDHREKPYFRKNIEFVSKGRSIMMIVQGFNCINGIRNIIGKRGQVGTLRGTYCNDDTENLVHASDSPEAAEFELNLFKNHF